MLNVPLFACAALFNWFSRRYCFFAINLFYLSEVLSLLLEPHIHKEFTLYFSSALTLFISCPIILKFYIHDPLDAGILMNEHF